MKNKKEKDLRTEEELGSFENAKSKGLKLMKLHNKAYVFSQKRIEEIVENRAFYEGNQYNLAKYKTEQPWVVQMSTPYSSIAIDTRVSSLIANDYMGTLQAYSPEDLKKVEFLQDAVSDLFGELGIHTKVKDAIHGSAIGKEAYMHIIGNKNITRGGTGNMSRGAFEAYALDTANVLLDPNARSFEDCDYMIVQDRISRDKAFAKYPILKRNESVLGSSSPQERGEHYLNNDYQTNQEDVLSMYIFYTKVYTTETKCKIKKEIVIADILVESKELKGAKRFPIAQLKWKDQTQSAYGISLMDDLIGCQKSINAIESAITNTALAYASPSMVVNRQSGIDPNMVANTIGAPGVVYSSNISAKDALAPVIAPQIDQQILAIKAQYEVAIDKIAGVTSQFVGNIGTAGNTAQGATQAVERSKIIEEMVLKNVAVFIEQIVRILVDYISYVYSSEQDGQPVAMSTRQITPSGDISFNEVDVPQGLDELNYSFYIDLATRTRYSELIEKQTLLELYQMERQYNAPVKLINEIDILEKSGLRSVDILKKRYKILTQQDGETKVATINQVIALGKQYEIPEELVKQAEIEIVTGDEKMETVQQVLQYAQQKQQQMQQQIQQSNQEARNMGIPEEVIRQQMNQVAEQGMTPSQVGIQEV